MELFSQVFFLLVFGLFLRLLLLLIEHPKKWKYAIIIFLAITLSVFLSAITLLVFICLISLFSPLLFFLDEEKNLPMNNTIGLVLLFYLLLALSFLFIVPAISFNLYPLILAVFLWLAHVQKRNHQKNLNEMD